MQLGGGKNSRGEGGPAVQSGLQQHGASVAKGDQPVVVPMHPSQGKGADSSLWNQDRACAGKLRHRWVHPEPKWGLCCLSAAIAIVPGLGAPRSPPKLCPQGPCQLCREDLFKLIKLIKSTRQQRLWGRGPPRSPALITSPTHPVADRCRRVGGHCACRGHEHW